MKSGNLNFLESLGHSRPVTGLLYLYVAVVFKYTYIKKRVGLQSTRGPGSAVGIATALRAGRSGDRIPVGTRFSAPVQTGPGTHPATCTMGTGSFPGVNSGRGVTLTPHSLLVPWSRKSRAIPLLPLWAVRPVQNLSVCTRVHFIFTFTVYTQLLSYM